MQGGPGVVVWAPENPTGNFNKISTEGICARVSKRPFLTVVAMFES